MTCCREKLDCVQLWTAKLWQFLWLYCTPTEEYKPLLTPFIGPSRMPFLIKSIYRLIPACLSETYSPLCPLCTVINLWGLDSCLWCDVFIAILNSVAPFFIFFYLLICLCPCNTCMYALSRLIGHPSGRESDTEETRCNTLGFSKKPSSSFTCPCNHWYMGPQLKVSSQRLIRWGIKLTTPGLLVKRVTARPRPLVV